MLSLISRFCQTLNNASKFPLLERGWKTLLLVDYRSKINWNIVFFYVSMFYNREAYMLLSTLVYSGQTWSKVCSISIILSTGGPRYMQSFYLRISLYAIEKWPFSGIYPLIYSDCRSFYMQIHYMLAYFWSPYLSHITRSTCTQFLDVGNISSI